MPPLFWSDSYRIGHTAIDHHHRLLVEDMSHLQHAIDAEAPVAEILTRYDQWVDHFARHAREEETLMQRLRQPNGIEHRNRHTAEHAAFLDQARYLRTSLASDANPAQALEELSLNLITFDLIQRDFEMIGLLLRESVLSTQD